MADEDIFDVEGLAKGLIKGLDTPKDLLVDFPLGVVQAGANIVRGEDILEDSLPNVPGFEQTIQFMGDLEKSGDNIEEYSGMLASGVGSSVALVKILDQIKAKNPRLFKQLRKVYPFSVGQFYVAMKAQPDGPGKIKKVLNALKGTLPQGYKGETAKATVIKKVLPKLLRLNMIGGLIGSMMTKEANPDGDFYVDSKGDKYPFDLVNEFFTFDDKGDLLMKPSALEEFAEPEPEEPSEGEKFTDEFLSKDRGALLKGADRLATGGEPQLVENIFEETGSNEPEGIQVAGNFKEIFGKAPVWATAGVEKAKTLIQQFTKNEKKNMENISSKLGTEAEVNFKEDIDILDTPTGETAVGSIKNKKTIIDSPEPNESVFYSGLEARLMDPNTPKTFNSVDEFFTFMNAKGVSRPEVEDNLLTNFLEAAKKTNSAITKKDLLSIVRKSPMRKIQTVTYGSSRYGGEKRAKYDGYQEAGALPGSYREDVIFLDPENIPFDPKVLPKSGHDFAEDYVLAWSRKTDRNATLPVEKTKQGIELSVDPAMIRTLKRNSTKLKNQLKGLEASAYEKIRRAYDLDITPLDEMNPRMVTESVDSRMSFLEDIDMPLANQIRQFRSKIQNDNVKLEEMEASTVGKKVVVTMADEIQSDILQQAKEMENNLRKSLGDLIDASAEKRRLAIAQADYSSPLRDIDPAVAEFYLKNKNVFRPLFKTDEDMQQFIDEFAKTKNVFEELAEAGPNATDDLRNRVRAAYKKETELLSTLETQLSEDSIKKLFPNVPFKNRTEWGELVIKSDLANAANLLYGPDKIPDAAQWYAISPAKFIKKRYESVGLNKGGTNTPIEERKAAKEAGEQLKGIGVEEFYGGPESIDPKGKHYTSVLEKALKRAAKENNSEFKIIEVEGMGKVYAVKITPEMLLPHKTHRKKGGMVYTPEIIDIFEAA
jgi:hypothetical protein